MSSLKFSLFTIKNPEQFIHIKSSNKALLLDFLEIFECEYIDSSTVALNPYQENTPELRIRITDFINKHEKSFPQMKGMRKTIEDMAENEYFLLLPFKEFTIKERYEIENKICEINNQGKLMVKNEFIENIMTNYEIESLHLSEGKKTKIGEPNKLKRVCRFCGKKYPEVNFKKEAHAISEAIGNKNFILNEECDSCNEFFDRSIERDFIYYHDLLRTFLGIQNKDNEIPKLKGKNFQLERGNNNSVAIISDHLEELLSNTPDKLNYNLETGKKIKAQNIYKALCKYSLSLISSKNIQYFNDTIAWIKEESKQRNLPLIATIDNGTIFSTRPEVVLFIRRNDDINIPFLVAQFIFSVKIYIFIVPFCSKDKKDFCNPIDYDNFLRCFDIKDKVKFISLNNWLEHDLLFNITIQKK